MSFFVTTHKPALDQALAEHTLERDDYTYFGMILLRTQRRPFEHRLAACGINPTQLARMTCPNGIEGVASKAPASIAIAIAAQLLRVVEQRHLYTISQSP
ncbi:XdhC family protein [Mycetohabitans sp. B46]|uniref:XdhC family protein n=1 Tax=Mycetohabitans sp. B46 TaxID=2772536 RepID=UPI00307FAB16